MDFTYPVPVTGRDGTPAVALGAFVDQGAAYLFVVADDGSFRVWDYDEATAKFPPDGPYRLLLGWAEKGRR